ncbi:MAG: SUMF1/EgtB/PvdO family nonheme iron enzyme [Terriglobia bacterium]
MKSSLIRFVIIVAFLGPAQVVSGAQGILQNNHWIGLFPRSGRYAQGVVKTGKAGMGWEPAAPPWQAPGAVKPQPLTKQQLLELVVGGVPNQRAAELVRGRGIDFQVDDDYVRTLRQAGANDLLIGALRKASVTTAGVLVETAPNAQVFLDGNLQGQADAQGVMMMRAKLGAHTLKVSLAGKRDFEQSVTVAEGRPTRVVAPLADLTGSLRVKALAGAAIWLDDSSRGTIDSSGELLLSEIPPGAHVLRVTARGKVDDSRSVVVAAGAETPVEVALAEGVGVNPQDALKYVWIAPGNFMMGCSLGDSDCSDPEKPAHRVTLRTAYWIGQTEVTVGAYKRFVEAAKAKMPPVAPKLYRGWKNDSFPIVDVIWNEASQYCAWAGGRLPTEAEWEYAARGGSPQARYGDLSEIAWSKENAGNQTHEVAAKLANGFGLYDMLGNVWEWVSDWYGPNYYQSGATQDPSGPETGQEKVLRGGSWIVDPKLLRVSDRYSIKPDARSDFFGFRCVWEPKTP